MRKNAGERFEKDGYFYTKSNGRLQYTPELHTNYKKPWSLKDLIFLCGMWEARERGEGKSIALGLGRTYSTVLDKVHRCRKNGSYEHYVELFKKGVA